MSESNLIPEGHYRAVAVPSIDESGRGQVARFAYSKGGTRQVVVYLELLDADNVRLPWYGFFTKDSAKRTVQSLRYMGFRGDDLAAAESQALDQIVSVAVGHEQWEGKTYARINWVNAPGGGVVKLANPMGSDDLRKFAAMMRGSVQGVPEVEGERRTTLPPPSEARSGLADQQSQGDLSTGMSWDSQSETGSLHDDVPF